MTLKTYIEFSVTYTLNQICQILYNFPFFKKIPLNTLIQSPVKTFLVSIYLPVSILFTIIKKGFYLGLLTLFAFVATQTHLGISQAHAFAILFIGFASLNQMSQLFMDVPQRWIITRQFMVRPIDYYRVNTKYYTIDRLIYGVLIFLVSLQFGFIAAFVLALFPFAVFLLVESYTRFIFEKTNKKLTKLQVAGRLFLSILLGVTILSLLYFPNLHVFALLPLLLVILVGLRSIKSSQCFDEVQRYMIQYMTINQTSEDIIEKTNKDQLKVDDDVDTTQTVKESLVGYKYLNALFFKRHRRLWLKTIRSSLIIFFGLLVLLTVSKIILSYLYPEYLIQFNQDNTAIVSLSGPLLFILFYSNRTQILTKSMYLNCDYALLHYPFYKKANYMWKQYLIRLRTIMVINMIQPLLIVLLIIFIQMIGLISFLWIDVLYLTINLVSGSFIVSSLYLSLYYMFQPFNKKMSIKNGFYSFFSGLMTFFFLYARTSIEHISSITWALPTIFIVCLIASLIGVRILAPKNFKYKN